MLSDSFAENEIVHCSRTGKRQRCSLGIGNVQMQACWYLRQSLIHMQLAAALFGLIELITTLFVISDANFHFSHRVLSDAWKYAQQDKLSPPSTPTGETSGRKKSEERPKP